MEMSGKPIVGLLRGFYAQTPYFTVSIIECNKRVQRRREQRYVAKIQNRLMALLCLGWPNSSEAGATTGVADRRGGRKGRRLDDVVATCYQL